ncbi:MAG TPA: Calx-beta domain-containing protein [Verrucomicrobiae bacterium]|nr:Calx-beta domain-containing protein [Verrucomicrobiae bacterium]
MRFVLRRAASADCIRRGNGWPAPPPRTARFLILLTAATLAIAFLPAAARAQTGTVAFSQTTYTVTTAQSNATINIVFTGSTDDTAFIDFSTSDGTAADGVNYVGTMGTNFTLSFQPNILTDEVGVVTAGPVTNTILIGILGGGAPQSTQTVSLALANPDGPITIGNQGTATLQIINTNVAVEQVQFAQSTYTADDTDTVATITMVRIGDTNESVTVNFNTQDGSAQAGVDYSNTTETVTFSSGTVSNTVAIPLIAPPPNALKTNQTVKLVLSNPTGGAALGSPSRAILTIRATGPPVIQFSDPAYRVHEHVGRATVTAIRFGDSSAQATADYATSDGTAQNGIDYFSTNGTLIFSPNSSRAGFTFQIMKFSTFQSNKTVNVTLSNATGASLGTQVTAVVTIVNDRPQTIVFTNSSGAVITLSLRSIGVMQVLQPEPLNLLLDETEAATKITMLVKNGRNATGFPQIDQITGASDCGLIDARAFDVVGAGIQLGGYLKQLRIHDLTNDAVVISSDPANRITSISAHNLMDGCVIDIGNRINRLQAARLGNGASLAAPQIGSVSLKGDKKAGISGDCAGTITISGDGLAANQLALGSLNVAGTINGASVIISNGSAGAVTASWMIDSTLYLGYSPNISTNPISGGGTFVDGTRLGSVNIHSLVNAFINSDIAASQIGSARFSTIVTSNGGLPFGVTAQRISGASCKRPPFRFFPNGPNDQSLGDFHVLRQ